MDTRTPHPDLPSPESEEATPSDRAAQTDTSDVSADIAVPGDVNEEATDVHSADGAPPPATERPDAAPEHSAAADPSADQLASKRPRPAAAPSPPPTASDHAGAAEGEAAPAPSLHPGAPPSAPTAPAHAGAAGTTVRNPQLPASRRQGRIIAVANQKGGVGKTTTAINLAASLALAGRHVLLVDVDPQGNLTSGVGAKAAAPPGHTIYDALTEDPLPDLAAFVLPTSLPNLFIVPADRNLTGAEIELVSMPERERRLAALVRPLAPRFDYVLIDCPPSLGLMTLNALVAADTVLIPMHCEYFALEGLAELVSTLRRVRSALNRRLDIEGVLLTMYDDRTNLGQQVARDVRDFFKEKVFETIIPRNVRVAEAPSHGLPVVLYDGKSRGAEAYLTLAREMIARDDGATATGSGK